MKGSGAHGWRFESRGLHNWLLGQGRVTTNRLMLRRVHMLIKCSSSLLQRTQRRINNHANAESNKHPNLKADNMKSKAENRYVHIGAHCLC